MPLPDATLPGLLPRTLELASPEFAALAETLLRDGRALRFRATGTSMRPCVRDGDVLTVQPAATGAYRPGHIVLCRGAAGVVAHRLQAIQHGAGSPRYLIRGDASIHAPEALTGEQLLGLVTMLQRGAQTRRLDHPAARWRGRIWAWRQSVKGWVRGR